ncbi:MAG: hypothetical protein ACRC3J_05020 [Culicoidibacterales bacterium]
MKTLTVFGLVFNRDEYVQTLETYIRMRNKMQSSVGACDKEYDRLIAIANTVDTIDEDVYNVLSLEEINVLEIIEDRMKVSIDF